MAFGICRTFNRTIRLLNKACHFRNANTYSLITRWSSSNSKPEKINVSNSLKHEVCSGKNLETTENSEIHAIDTLLQASKFDAALERCQALQQRLRDQHECEKNEQKKMLKSLNDEKLAQPDNMRHDDQAALMLRFVRLYTAIGRWDQAHTFAVQLQNDISLSIIDALERDQRLLFAILEHIESIYSYTVAVSPSLTSVDSHSTLHNTQNVRLHEVTSKLINLWASLRERECADLLAVNAICLAARTFVSFSQSDVAKSLLEKQLLFDYGSLSVVESNPIQCLRWVKALNYLGIIEHMERSQAQSSDSNQDAAISKFCEALDLSKHLMQEDVNYSLPNDARQMLLKCVSSIHDNLAQLHAAHDDVDQALSILRRGIDMLKNFSSPLHYDLIALNSGIIQLLFKKNADSEAKVLIDNIASNVDFANVGVLDTIASICRTHGRLELAENLFNLSLQLQKSNDSQNVQMLAGTSNQLGIIYLQLDANEKALNTLLQSLEYQKKLFGSDDDPQLAGVYHNVGTAQSRLPAFLSQAESNLRSADSCYQRLPPSAEADLHRGMCLIQLGDLKMVQKDFSAAERLFVDGIGLKLAALDKKAEVAADMNKLAAARMKLGKKLDAISVYRESLRLLSAEFGQGDSRSALTEFMLADALLSAEQHASAVSAFDHAISALRNSELSPKQLVPLLQHYIKALGAAGEQEKAKRVAIDLSILMERLKN